MSIFNGTFTDTVKKQLSLRQNAKSANAPADNSNLVYNNAKTAWVRMSSSVDVTVNTQSGPILSSDLARSYVLEGGTLFNRNGDAALRAGIGKPDPRKGNPVGGAYGDLGDRTLGLRPMPGIVSMNVQNQGYMGSLRKAVVNYHCWDMTQLSALEKLYMRPGYSALLEWGSSMYLDNKTQKLITNKHRIDIINDNRVSYNKVLDGIEAARVATSGNYDAMLGLISNFTWTSRNDGGYDCVLELISIGSLLESMKINYVSSVASSASNGKGIFYLGSVGEAKLREDLDNMYGKGKIIGLFRELLAPHYRSGAGYVFNEVGNKYHDLIHQVRHIYFKQNEFIDIRTNSQNAKLGTFYMPLDGIVDIINEFILLRNTKDSNPITSLSTKDKKGNNIKCVSHKLQTSVNPNVCIVLDNVNSHKITYNIDGSDREFTVNRPKLTGGKVAKPVKYYYEQDYNTGNIGSIYISIEFFLYTIQKNINVANNTLDIYSAIKAILKPTQQALGGINNFDIFIDPDDNVGRIIDYTYIEENKTRKSKFVFKTTGLGSIIRENGRSMSSFISPEAATMISIAARAVNSDNTMGLDVDSLIRFNQGLVDRIFPAKVTPEDSENVVTEKFASKVEKINKTVADLNKYVELLSSPLVGGDESNIITLISSLIYDFNNLLPIIKKQDTNKNKKINNFIIPVTLTLRFDGISGINIGEVFVLPLDELPDSYRESNVGFIVKECSHEISGNDWVTVLGTQICILE